MFGKYLEELNTNTQFIIITHKREQWNMQITCMALQCKSLVYQNLLVLNLISLALFYIIDLVIIYEIN